MANRHDKLTPPAEYPAIYRDARGQERTTIVNDGTTLMMTVRGVSFKGLSPDSWEPAVEPNGSALSSFSRDSSSFDELTDCSVEFVIPLWVNRSEGTIQTKLTIFVDIMPSVTTPDGRVSRWPKVRLELALTLGAVTYRISRVDSDFETAMCKLQELLPPDLHLRCCYGYTFSDYSVYGVQFFGSMMCFRNIKVEYLALKGKDMYMQVMDDERVVNVQETHLCHEFAVRAPGTGYRG